MSISVECPSCGKKLKAPDSAAGRRARCPQCGTAVPIPEAVYDAEEFDEEDGDSHGLESPDDYEAPAPPPRQRSKGEKRRPCPMCGEMIAATAVKCRYCGEVFDPALKRATPRRSDRWDSAGEMTAIDWVLCVLCPGIGCIVGIVACIRGDSSRGGKMIGFAFLFGFLWNVLRFAIEAMNR